MIGLIEQMNAMKEVQEDTQKELGEIKRFRASYQKMMKSKVKIQLNGIYPSRTNEQN